ncbi:MAG: acyloxyacyl hydrolase [Phycisphaerales bacterium]|nr:acyloxyacyl hydrolase [Phycisphaerales bacterium]
MNIARNIVLAGCVLSASSFAACAESVDGERAQLSMPLVNMELTFQPPADAPVAEQPKSGVGAESAAARSLAYGRTGSRWWTIGGLFANDFEDASDVNIHGAFSEFLADELEFAVEVGAWYFNQPGDDTGGLSGSMIFRWHFLHAEDYRWTIFGDAGIGLLGAFDNVPDGGTGFNFLPRVGGGFTWAFNESTDGESRGPRLMVGVRWHHISNARIQGDDNNPGRDELAGYLAVTFPF